MRIGTFAGWLVLLRVIAFPIGAHAQFQQPTDQELKMTEDPKAPGAAAVYLNMEEIDNDPVHYQRFHVRIKVLQEKGKELATVELPYVRGNFKIGEVKGRTIHSDGTVIPFVGKPEDLLITKTGERQIGRRVFTLPSVEVGSILEYVYQIDYDDNHFSSPRWDLQQKYFVHQAHYSFTPFVNFQPGAKMASNRFLVDSRGNSVNTLIWWTFLPPGVVLQAVSGTSYSVDVTDVPPIPDEEWMPPIESILYKVQFYYKSADNATDFWVSEAKRWSKEVDHFAEPSKAIRAAVSGVIAPADNDMEKAKKIYTAVQALDNTDYSRRKRESELKQLNLKEAKRAEDTWAQKSGNSEEIALLYLAMLRAAGLNAYDMRVADREIRVFDPGYLNFDQLDDDLIILNADGKQLPLDPGEKMCPFLTLSWRHSGTGGIRETAHGQEAGKTPEQPYAANTISRVGDLTVDEHGSVKGSINFVMTGQEALRWRQASLENDVQELKKQFDHWMESMFPENVEGHIDHFVGLDDPDVLLIAMVNVKGSLGTATARRVILPGLFFQTRGAHPFVNEEKRQVQVDMRYGEKLTDQIVYHLPVNLAVEGSPQDSKVMWQGHAALSIVTKVAPGEVTVVRQMARAFTFVKPEEYQDLRGFYEKVAAADQQEVVLTRATGAKGN